MVYNNLIDDSYLLTNHDAHNLSFLKACLKKNYERHTKEIHLLIFKLLILVCLAIKQTCFTGSSPDASIVLMNSELPARMIHQLFLICKIVDASAVYKIDGETVP